MTDTLLRHWQMLRLVPRAPVKVTADELCDRLAGHGYEVSKRTVERDLEKLSAAFPLVSDTRNKPYGWQWQRDAPRFDIPAMDMPTALTFHFVHEYLEPLLPGPVRERLASHFDAARKVLNTQSSRSLPRWSDKVMVIPQGMSLKAPPADETVSASVYEAVLHSRRLGIRYRPRSRVGMRPRDYVLDPLGLVLRNQLCYLVATAFEYDDVLHFALHRIDRAEVLEESAKWPDGFSLREYVELGAFDYPVGDAITLKAVFASEVAHHLAETPLSDDQRLKPAGDGLTRVTATVRDTRQLRWWLRAFGDQVEVEAPKRLRRELAEAANSLAARYA